MRCGRRRWLPGQDALKSGKRRRERTSPHVERVAAGQPVGGSSEPNTGARDDIVNTYGCALSPHKPIEGADSVARLQQRSEDEGEPLGFPRWNLTILGPDFPENTSQVGLPYQAAGGIWTAADRCPRSWTRRRSGRRVRDPVVGYSVGRCRPINPKSSLRIMPTTRWLDNTVGNREQARSRNDSAGSTQRQWNGPDQ